MKNMAHQYVESLGKTLAEVRDEYDGACIDFAGDFLDWLRHGRMTYFDELGSSPWRYHAAVEDDGLIHDLWIEQILPTEPSVLCWVLGHEHNPLFAAYLNKVEEEMKSMGFGGN